MTGRASPLSIRRLRATGRVSLAIGMLLVLTAFLLPSFSAPAEAVPEEKCTTYYFEYTDGHIDQGVVCDDQPVNNLTRALVPSLHALELHISCSDDFSTPVYNGDEFLGWDSEGISDLDGHIIVDGDGNPNTTADALWGINKSWTGEGGDDCGMIPPPPDPANPAATLGFDCTDGLYIMASNDGDLSADLDVYQGETLIDTITVPGGTTSTKYLVDGEDIAEDGSASFSVTYGESTLDTEDVQKDCENVGNPSAVLAFDCTDGLSVTVSNDGDGDATVDVYQGDTLIDSIDVPAGTDGVKHLVDGEDIAEDGSATFSVTYGESTLDTENVVKDCEGPAPDPTPSVDVEKLVSLNGTDFVDADDSPGATFQLAAADPAQQVWFRVIVTNDSGDGTVLTLNSLTDAVTSPSSDAMDALNLSSCTFPATGLADGDDVTCTFGPFTAIEGAQHTNRVTVSATGAGESVGDFDDANYSGTRVAGVVIDRPPPPAPEPDPEPDPAPEQLPATGVTDLWLAGLALMLIGGGLLTIARGRAMVAVATPTTWTTRRMP